MCLSAFLVATQSSQAALTASSVTVHAGQAANSTIVNLDNLTVDGNSTTSPVSLGLVLDDYIVFANSSSGSAATGGIVNSLSAGTSPTIGDTTTGAFTDSTGPANFWDFTIGATTILDGGIRSADLSGSVDLTGFVSGTIHFIYGTFVDGAEVIGNDGNGTPVSGGVQDQNSVSGTNTGTFLTSFTFDSSATNTFTFTLTNDDTDGSRARILGIVTTDFVPIPEPSSMGLLGLASTMLLMLRKRR